MKSYIKVISSKRFPGDKERLADLVFFDDATESEVHSAWLRAMALKSSGAEQRRIVLGYPVRHRGSWSAAPVTYYSGLASP